jgi:Ion transport protein
VFQLIKILEVVTIVRILRLVIYLQEIQTFKIIIESIKCLLSPFWSILTVLFSIFYLYALLGSALWGGRINFYTEEIRNNDSTPYNWGLNNFNDFISSFITLFSLMVVNNWMLTAEMYVNISETRLVLIFFVTFYLFAVLIGLNVVVCFAIDMYAAIRRLDGEQRSHEDRLFRLTKEVKLNE